MRITLVNSSTSGGAYRAMYRLHCDFKRMGHQSIVFTQGNIFGDDFVRFRREPESYVKNVYKRARYKFASAKMGKYTLQRFGKLAYFENPTVLWGPENNSQFPDCDVLHLHDIKGFLDYRLFFGRMFSNGPIVWTLHDMTPFTGGCDYDYQCGRFQDTCGCCPTLGSLDQGDQSAINLTIKASALAQVNAARFRLASPSRWLASEARKSRVLGRFAIDVVPNGINLVDFAPRDKALARDIVGVGKDDFVFLAIGNSLDDYRKGFHLLEKVLLDLPGNAKTTLLAVGLTRLQLPSLGMKVRYLAAVNDDRLLSFVYSAADLSIVLSLADNLPNVVLESLGCGTPVIAFDVGGMSDMIENHVNGVLSPVEDTGYLREQCISLMAHRTDVERMSLSAREIALKRFCVTQQSRAYMKLYENLILGRSDETPAEPDKA